MKYIFIFWLLAFSINLFSQTDEDLLNHKLVLDDTEIIMELQIRGFLSEGDTRMLGMYLVKMLNQGANFDSLTYGQLIDSLSVYKNEMDKQTAIINNFGEDSIYLRNPNGEKWFIATGEMSLEELVERESNDLPTKYTGKRLNMRFEDPNSISKIINEYKLDESSAILFGNVILIKAENGEDLTEYRVGDFLEIAERIKKSDEFAPILRILEED